MALQVGSFCYATPVDAGAAACAAVVPTSSVSGSSVVTLSCVGSDDAGALHMQTAIAPANGSASAVVATVVQPVAYAPCQQADYVAAAETIVGGALAVWVIWWGYRQVIEQLRWGRGDAT